MRQSTNRHVATVFGGAGFIGRYVVQRLAARGYVVRVAGRNPAGARFLQTQGSVGQIVPLSAGVADEGACARAVAGADLVVNLVGILQESKAGDFQRIQAEGAGRIARLAAAAGVERLVHVSAIGADPASPSQLRPDQGRRRGGGAQRLPGRRPSFVPPSSSGRRTSSSTASPASPGCCPIMPVVAGASRFQPVYVGDVADAVMAAATREDALGKTFELGGPRVASFRELLRFILDTTGHRRPLVDLPAALVKLQVAHRPAACRTRR